MFMTCSSGEWPAFKAESGEGRYGFHSTRGVPPMRLRGHYKPVREGRGLIGRDSDTAVYASPPMK